MTDTQEAIARLATAENFKGPYTVRVLYADLRALLASHDELVKGLRWAVTELDEWDQYQRRPTRSDYGVECACCMGEMFDKDALERITSLKDRLKELGE